MRWWDAGWKSHVARGVIAIVFGVFAVAWPVSTALALALLWGIWALSDGFATLAQAAGPAPGRARLGLVLLSVVAIAAGLFAVLSPAVTAVTLTWILGIWLIVRGAVDLALGLLGGGKPTSWLALLLSVAIDVFLGVLFFTNPGRSALGIATVLGLSAIAWGLAMVVLGFLSRREERRPSEGSVTGTGPA